jgi:hypothetical protein
MSILKRKGDTTTSGQYESRGKGKVVGSLAVRNKTTGKVETDYIFDKDTISQIHEEYLKEKEEYPTNPPATIYTHARKKVLKERDLELYE